ncbi:TPA: hypothetical protein IXN05_002505 [Enterococcus faecium]|nr:hypothetical protein [Enterococcus faecium]HAQ3315115.1 hypothetical protein [Enterococcus faecium]HAQ3421616.1 hypothetical protein [Enterococcus faecium]HAQ3436737.1 hypothetical protein [Enterococcus faecium]
MSVFELPTVTLIPNGIHHPPIEDGRLLPNSVKESMQSHAELNEKALFLTSAQTYIEGLCQQNKRRENEQ